MNSLPREVDGSCDKMTSGNPALSASGAIALAGSVPQLKVKFTLSRVLSFSNAEIAPFPSY